MEEAERQLDALSDSEFFGRTIRTPWGAEMTVARAFEALIEHDIHHRTQLYLYLRQLGEELTSQDLFG